MLWQDADDPPAAYEAAGRGAPVLFLQGRFADGSLWAPVAEVLSGRYRTVRVRLQQAASRGANARPAEAVMALMDRLGFPSAHLISHGTRWSTIAEVAVRHPSRARSLTLVYP
ncbi:MAG TPA: hypothetical protein VD902_13045, partial [Symbiobacteriaceae bacterium]|nr:hypothetical protein [Symbiobacteriaceae bacterium]